MSHRYRSHSETRVLRLHMELTEMVYTSGPPNEGGTDDGTGGGPRTSHEVGAKSLVHACRSPTTAREFRHTEADRELPRSEVSVSASRPHSSQTIVRGRRDVLARQEAIDPAGDQQVGVLEFPWIG
jgi:hypothetical protein